MAATDPLLESLITGFTGDQTAYETLPEIATHQTGETYNNIDIHAWVDPFTGWEMVGIPRSIFNDMVTRLAIAENAVKQSKPKNRKR